MEQLSPPSQLARNLDRRPQTCHVPAPGNEGDGVQGGACANDIWGYNTIAFCKQALWRDTQSSGMMQNYPKRIEGLDISLIDDGFVIHEEEKDRVHYLNDTANIVLLLCNGANSASDIADMLQEHFQLDEPPLNDVESILESFLEDGLIVQSEGTELSIKGAARDEC